MYRMRIQKHGIRGEWETKVNGGESWGLNT